MKNLIFLLLLLSSTSYGKVADVDFKTQAELGGVGSRLTHDTKVWITALGLNETLFTAITNGDLSGGGGGSGPRSEVWLYCVAACGQGSVNTKIRYFDTVGRNIGSSITYNHSTSLGDNFTINTTGVYAITYVDVYSAGTAVVGLSLNSAQLSTDITTISAATMLGFSDSQGAGAPGSYSVTLNLTAGDIIRAHGGILDGNNNFVQFRITQVSN